MDIRFTSAQLNPMVASALEKKAASVSTAPSVAPAKDQVQLSHKEQKSPKVGFVQRIKNLIAGVKKAYVVTTQYTKALVNGTVKGAIIGSGVYGTLKAVDFMKNYKQETVKHIPKQVVIGAAAVAGLTKLGFTLFKSSLDVNEAKSKIEHRWQHDPHDEDQTQIL
ncbi:MAG: hypothetical protein ACD_20C00346G0027 [uncultured bacterium]|nr:MAG: hypothetical protein ACD_20C00346G0027 [uncultured bacterium]HBH17832.1 hypothetical protein [Cyanobacteria bacterium UBA9579]